ncbi:uncharacterized protein SPSK_02795 [Sporothrix schenckii 1099-18]|uniref:DUF2423 domain-containing protein n=1 Tax=Sporothrix schenckii 1099-18 TaxID=1397361 RepID=A0A0F2M9F9_SPOSC|nr:uncharacterized protein SPSK_02795 [Sporothrix schenckii 1099-18]KJR86348.1 hypothetical protein SPSK_02795 [Sporothrix schenckii 1099-18]
MAKSARASSRKNNNQKLKKNVFGPVESARTERLSAKLMELAAQPAPVKEAKEDPNAMEDVADADEEPTPSDQLKEEASAMEVDSGAILKKPLGKKRIEKRRAKKGSIVFPKYKDRTSKRRK